MADYEAQARELLHHAGVEINGGRPWDIQVHDSRLYRRVFARGSLGLGEAYMDGWWDVAHVDEFFARVLAADLEKKFRLTPAALFAFLKARLSNTQNKTSAFDNGQRHYDLGNDLYQAMLDTRLVYTCGYWNDAASLDEAQVAKLDLVCRKLSLKPGQRVLDIGCGWGSFAKFAAERYGVSMVGITVSQEQVELGRQLCAGLPVEIRLQDYRDVDERFDHVVSLGMFEHVGYKNYRAYMNVARRCLAEDGLFLLHTIGNNKSVRSTDPWLHKYIFPNSMLPSAAQISRAIEGLFVMEDWHNFGADYDKTLMAWCANFERRWDSLRKKYGERFHRMWRYYLLSCAGLFRARKAQLWQIVLSPRGVTGGYASAR